MAMLAASCMTGVFAGTVTRRRRTNKQRIGCKSDENIPLAVGLAKIQLQQVMRKFCAYTESGLIHVLIWTRSDLVNSQSDAPFGQRTEFNLFFKSLIVSSQSLLHHNSRHIEQIFKQNALFFSVDENKVDRCVWSKTVLKCDKNWTNHVKSFLHFKDMKTWTVWPHLFGPPCIWYQLMWIVLGYWLLNKT